MRLTKNQGFTLMEILTVIVIIVILAGLLTPAISKAQRQAKKVECMNNLRQIGMAIHQYALDYNGDFPDTLLELTQLPAGDPYLSFPAGTNMLACTGGGNYANPPANLTIAGATAGTVVTQCLNPVHPGNTRNVLYGDGHVGSVVAAAP